MSEYPKLNLFIDGEWLEAGDRDLLPVFDPATQACIGELPKANTADLDRAIAAAERAGADWAATPAFDRYKVMRRAAALLRERASGVAVAMSLEQGKPVGEAKVELETSADVIDWYAEEGRRAYGRVIPARTADSRMIVKHEPVGVVAAFTPWNFPAVIPARKIAAALAAGCSCIFKPAEETPATGLMLAQAFHDAGVPKGVLNVVFGDPDLISRHLIGSGSVRKVSFTGSTAVGKHLARLCADTLARATLELGGHAPVVVLDDADVEKAAAMSVASKYRNAGQVCVSPTRFFIHESIFDRFASAFAEHAANIRVGNGQDSATQMGPVASERRRDAINAMVEDALDRGASALSVRPVPNEKSNFLSPVVLRDVPAEARLMNEEPFGPVATLSRFSSLDEVIERANSLPYALAAFAFTASSRNARRVGDGLQAGMVGINTFAITTPESPFGGTKESGYGSEGGLEGLFEYMNTKFIHEA